ncbi:MAG: NAD(+)--rifampin ADP-ribosyltransferase [Bacteroidota bacterium]
MEFNPNNPIVKLCIGGMALEDTGKAQEAGNLFLQAFNEATNDFEKFMAAYYVARHQPTVAKKLTWLTTALQHALNSDSYSAKSALHSLHKSVTACYAELGDEANALKNNELALSFKDNLYDKGPFYHGTKADLHTGDLLNAGSKSNYQSELVMNHIYFTALANGAGLGAALAKGDGRERVYIVEPTGPFENDPNLTDKKFPGNPSRSYRSQSPLKIVGEVSDWIKQTPEDIQKWREKLANNKGDIIN